MTGKSENLPYEPNDQEGDEVVTRADLQAEEKPSEPGKPVKLKSPSGAKVQTAEENVEALKAAGYK
jgi:hypothetical protein